MGSIQKAEQIIIPESRSQGYKRWVERGVGILHKELPFQGPVDIAITFGSGLGSIVESLQLNNAVTLTYEDLSLPIGVNTNHKKKLVAGITPEGKNVVAVVGRTHAYEIPEEGIETKTWGRLSRMELATGYLAMLNGIGVNNMVLTCAAGGINHPHEPFSQVVAKNYKKPFDEKSLPVIGLIASDVNLAYPQLHMGHYKADKGDFFGLRDGDPDLMNAFRQSMHDVGEPTEIPDIHYVTSLSTPSFEDRGIVWFTAVNGGQAVGMSYGYEKQFLSGVNGIKRFMGIAVITNGVELVYVADPNSERIISIEEMRWHRPHEFKLAHSATDEEVQRVGKLANDKLGRGLTNMTKSL